MGRVTRTVAVGLIVAVSSLAAAPAMAQTPTPTPTPTPSRTPAASPRPAAEIRATVTASGVQAAATVVAVQPPPSADVDASKQATVTIQPVAAGTPEPQSGGTAAKGIWLVVILGGVGVAIAAALHAAHRPRPANGPPYDVVTSPRPQEDTP